VELVVHWLRVRESGRRWRVWANGVVMVTVAATSIVALVYAQSLSPTAKAFDIEIDLERRRRREERWGK
jgi:hypothetical protein